jgi:hypothetical protein
VSQRQDDARAKRDLMKIFYHGTVFAVEIAWLLGLTFIVCVAMIQRAVVVVRVNFVSSETYKDYR